MHPTRQSSAKEKMMHFGIATGGGRKPALTDRSRRLECIPLDMTTRVGALSCRAVAYLVNRRWKKAITAPSQLRNESRAPSSLGSAGRSLAPRATNVVFTAKFNSFIWNIEMRNDKNYASLAAASAFPPAADASPLRVSNK